MADTANADYGTMDVNSGNQRWSRWIFGVEADRKLPTVAVAIDNARRYFSTGFGRAGRVRLDRQGGYYVFTVEVEGPPVHDPLYVRAVRRDFKRSFLEPGFGGGARLVKFEYGLLSGSREDGSPPEQFLVLPSVNLMEQD